MMHIDNDEQLSFYVFNSIRSWRFPALLEVLLEACRYNDVKMIDLMLATDGENYYRSQAAQKFSVDMEDKYMKHILDCDRADKIISLLPQLVSRQKIGSSEDIINNLVEAIKRNNYKATMLYFNDIESDRAIRTLEYVLQNEITISDEMFDLLMRYTFSSFNHENYNTFARLGKRIDFVKYCDNDFIARVTYTDITRLALLPESTLFDQLLERSKNWPSMTDTVAGLDAQKKQKLLFQLKTDINGGVIPLYYVANNNIAMLQKLHKSINFHLLYKKLILCAYISNSRDTFSYVFWTKNDHITYAYFMACVNRLNEKVIIFPREIIAKIMEPIVSEFWDRLVN